MESSHNRCWGRRRRKHASQRHKLLRMSLIIFTILLLQVGIAGATGHLWNTAGTSSAPSSSSLFLALPTADPASVMIEAVRLRVRASGFG